MRNILLAVLMSFLIVGCSTLPFKESTQVTLSGDAQFSYSGRGAGAGVALMSTMGPVGIAVGVAIDEGIRKDLNASATSAGFNIVELVASAANSKQLTSSEITILEYGMRDVRGSGDFMTPYLIYSSNGSEPVEIQTENAPEGAEPNLYTLQAYKENGSLIVEVFTRLLESEF